MTTIAPVPIVAANTAAPSEDQRDTARAEQLLVRLKERFLAPPPRVNTAQWAGQYRHIAKGSERGLWRNERTPYLVEPMLCASAFTPYEKVVLMFATQLGKTEVLYNAILQRIHTDPQDMMMVQPTLQDAQDHSGKRFIPTVQQTPILQGLVAMQRSRDESTSWRARGIQGGFAVFFAGANSAASIASKPLGFAVADEVDKWPRDVDNQGPPLALLGERMSNFPRRKLIIASTPTVKHASVIEDEYIASDQRVYMVPCPHCNHRQVLHWGSPDGAGLQWLKTDAGEPRADTAVYICSSCGAAIVEYHKTQMLADGLWTPRNPGAGRGLVAGFWLNKLYSPLGWTSWAALVEKFGKADKANKAGDTTALKEFKNSNLAETFAETGESADEHALQTRADAYPLGTVPVGGLVLTAGIDVQGDRWEMDVWAWGRGLESWLIDTLVIEGNPTVEADWQPLENYLMRRYPQAWHGGSMAIEATSIDTGHHTQAVYNFVLKMQHRLRIHAIKGSSEEGKPIKGTASPIEVTWQGKRWPHGLKLWSIGVHTAKDLLFGQLQINQPGPGYVHTPNTLPREWYEQLTAEQRIPVRTASGTGNRWVKRRPRNEKLDCRNYASHSAHLLGLHTLTDAKWLQIEQAVQPPRDLFSPPIPAPAPAPVPAPVPASVSTATALEPSESAPAINNAATNHDKPAAESIVAPAPAPTPPTPQPPTRPTTIARPPGRDW